MLTLAHAWSRTQKVLLVGAFVAAIGAIVAFAYSYERSHRLPDESILFGTWQMTAPHDSHSSTILGLYDIVGLWDGVRRSHWHDGTWVRYDTAKQMEGYSGLGWYAGGSNIYMRVEGERTAADLADCRHRSRRASSAACKARLCVQALARLTHLTRRCS